jgi:hypothetical protein
MTDNPPNPARGGNTQGLDPNIVEEFLAQLTRIADAQGRQQQQPLAVEKQQLRIALRYGAVRNALGNFGRHGETDVALVAPPPTLNVTTRALTLNTLPSNAHAVVVYDRADLELQRFPAKVSSTVDENKVAAVASVEIEDSAGTPFLFGIPVRVNGGVVL